MLVSIEWMILQKRDADWEGIYKKAAAITPVPGGVGPMTIAMLVQNTVDAAEYQK